MFCSLHCVAVGSEMNTSAVTIENYFHFCDKIKFSRVDKNILAGIIGECYTFSLSEK